MYKKKNEKRRNISGKQQDRSDQKRKEKIILSRAQTLFFLNASLVREIANPGKSRTKVATIDELKRKKIVLNTLLSNKMVEALSKITLPFLISSVFNKMVFNWNEKKTQNR